MIAYLFLLLCVPNSNCKDAYLDKVLESQNYAHYYLVLKVGTGNNKKEIIVLNSSLYHILKSRDTSLIDVKKYKDFVKKIVERNGLIQFSKEELADMKATIVIDDKAIELAAAKGKSSFLNKYFYVSEKYEYASLKHNFSSKLNTAIIKKLFEWNYLVGIVESNLSVLELNFCDNHSTVK